MVTFKIKDKTYIIKLHIRDTIDELSPVMSMSEISIFEYDDNVAKM